MYKRLNYVKVISVLLSIVLTSIICVACVHT